ncbi:MAG TPA: AI-2E family transporter [Patescibacteria group bacterium]|nr:AI-2E family transporter [Patescibacteria group bacterium]
MKKKILRKHNDLPAKITAVLVTYAKTLLLLMLIVTILSWFILSQLRVQFALPLALITGSASIVPVIGITVAAVIASIVAIFDGARFLPTTPVIVDGLAVIIAYGVLNVVVDYLLAPRLIGTSTGIHPVTLLVLVILGTASFGIMGALLTVPVVLVIKTVNEHYKTKRGLA